MPKYNFEGSILKSYSGVIEADSIDEARETLKYDMDWEGYDDSYTEIDWIEEVED